MPRLSTVSKGLGATATVSVLVALGYFVLPPLVQSDGDGNRQSSSGLDSVYSDPPHEYLYLDNDRVLAYLSQMENGITGQAKLSRSTADTTGGELSAAQFGKVRRERQSQEFVEGVVTPTATSRFYRLVGLLNERKQIRPLRPGRKVASLAALREIREGDFVVMEGNVKLPAFVRLYDRVLQSTTASPIGKLGARFVKALGPNPRIPLFVDFTPAGARPSRGIRVLLPARYEGLTSESTLFRGQLTIVGKIVYKFPRYRDRQTYTLFRNALTKAPRRLIRRVAFRPVALDRELRDATRFGGAGAVVVPVAIYK